jgi:hypothetical protein
MEAERDMQAEAGGIGATLTVGPTNAGMVRLLVEEEGHEIALDFEPDEAEEIADELRAAAGRARGAAGGVAGGAGARVAMSGDERR